MEAIILWAFSSFIFLLYKHGVRLAGHRFARNIFSNPFIVLQSAKLYRHQYAPALAVQDGADTKVTVPYPDCTGVAATRDKSPSLAPAASSAHRVTATVFVP